MLFQILDTEHLKYNYNWITKLCTSRLYVVHGKMMLLSMITGIENDKKKKWKWNKLQYFGLLDCVLLCAFYKQLKTHQNRWHWKMGLRAGYFGNAQIFGVCMTVWKEHVCICTSLSAELSDKTKKSSSSCKLVVRSTWYIILTLLKEPEYIPKLLEHHSLSICAESTFSKQVYNFLPDLFYLFWFGFY